MKIPATLGLILLAHSAFAAPQEIQIDARYSDFDRAWFAPFLDRKSKDFQAPRITLKAGQRGVIETVQIVPTWISPAETDSVGRGVTIEVTPYFKDGKITVFGKSVVRQIIEPRTKQPLSAKSFATRETYFGGTVENQHPVTIATGDKRYNKGKLTLTFTLVDPEGKPQCPK